MKILLSICVVFNIVSGIANYISENELMFGFNCFAAGVCAVALYVNIIRR